MPQSGLRSARQQASRDQFVLWPSPISSKTKGVDVAIRRCRASTCPPAVCGSSATATEMAALANSLARELGVDGPRAISRPANTGAAVPASGGRFRLSVAVGGGRRAGEPGGAGDAACRCWPAASAASPSTSATAKPAGSFRPATPPSLAELVNRLADDPDACARMGRQARARGPKNASRSRPGSEEYLDLYRTIASLRPCTCPRRTR